MHLKIVLLSHYFYPNIGGIETISELLANFFTTAGHEVHVVTWSEDRTDKTFPFAVIRKPGLQILFKENAWADVVFENNPSLRLSWPRLIVKRPSVVVLQTWLPGIIGRRTLSNRIKFLHLKRATKVVAISDAVRKGCWPAAAVIPNSYNADTFKVIPGIHRSKDFVFVGRLVSDKGADLAIKAIHLLNKKSANTNNASMQYSLTIVGEGDDRQSLDKLVKELELQHSVEFTGALQGEELAYNLNKHRFMLVPSVWKEPFGIVALEGMACGCVPIVSDGGGLPDAIGNAGLLFSRGDVQSLVERIHQLLTNPNLEQQLHAAAKDHLKLHHPNVIAQDYLDMIKRF